MKNITNLVLVTQDNCNECLSLKEKLLEIQYHYKLIILAEYDIKEFNAKRAFNGQFSVAITPALFVNNRLKLYGDTGIKKLHQLIKSNIS
ncbi:MAG: hypothetical protein K8I03_04905 [Ignavibacteria bacterium]|nr:hypothetical protein [Ignavibacteria bacterium]